MSPVLVTPLVSSRIRGLGLLIIKSGSKRCYQRRRRVVGVFVVAICDVEFIGNTMTPSLSSRVERVYVFTPRNRNRDVAWSRGDASKDAAGWSA